MAEIYSLVLQETLGERSDVIRWSAQPQPYNSRLGYNVIMGLDDSSIAHWRKVWNFKVPPKIQIFLWKYFHNILPLKIMLSSRVHANMDSICSLCQAGEESREHLIWECPLVKRVWILFLDWWNVGRNVLQSQGNFFQLIQLVRGSELKVAWSTSLIALLWTI